MNCKTIKIINPEGSNSRWVLQHRAPQLPTCGVCPGLWRGRGEGQGQAGTRVVSKKKPGLAAIPLRTEPVGLRRFRIEAVPEWQVCLLLSNRRSPSVKQSRICRAATMWHRLALGPMEKRSLSSWHVHVRKEKIVATTHNVMSKGGESHRTWCSMVAFAEHLLVSSFNWHGSYRHSHFRGN